VPKKELARVQGTSGTTGKPTAFGISRGDMARIAEAHARIMWGFGIRQDDIVFIGSFFSLYWGSWGLFSGRLAPFRQLRFPIVIMTRGDKQPAPLHGL
jgi:phenylacetate-CoA ligase